MLNTLHKISTYFIIFLGIVHLGFTPVAYKSFTLNTVWFVGTGLAAVFVGVLNLVFLRVGRNDSVVRVLSFAATVLMLLFFTLGVIMVPEARMAPAWIALLLLGVSCAGIYFAERHKV